MINKQTDNLIERMKALKLSPLEKSDILARTFSVIEQIDAVSEHAIPSPIFVSNKTNIKSSFFSAWGSYISSKKFVPAFAAVLLLVMTGGVSLAAEGALPGDSLYSLKINVNEQVRDLAAVTPSAKGHVAVEATERRLQEAATLSARGQLNNEKKAIVQKEFIKHADQVKNQVASLVSENDITGAQEIAANFESSLRAHEVILEKISTDTISTDSTHLTSLIATVKTELATTTVSRVGLQTKEVEAGTYSKEKASAKIKEIRASIADAINMRVNYYGTLSTSTDAIAAAKISFAQVSSIKAEGFVASSSFADAIGLLQQAGNAVNDAESAMSTELGLDLDVRTALGISRGDNISATSTSTTGVATTTASSTIPATATSTATTTAAISGTTTNSVLGTSTIAGN